MRRRAGQALYKPWRPSKIHEYIQDEICTYFESCFQAQESLVTKTKGLYAKFLDLIIMGTKSLPDAEYRYIWIKHYMRYTFTTPPLLSPFPSEYIRQRILPLDRSQQNTLANKESMCNSGQRKKRKKSKDTSTNDSDKPGLQTCSCCHRSDRQPRPYL